MRLILFGIACSLLLVPFVFLDAAPVPASKIASETFVWNGEKRTRSVRKLKCGTESMEFVKIPKGSFTMGSNTKRDPAALDQETPAHKVTFSQDIWVAKYPLTKGQFAAFVKAKDYKTEQLRNEEGKFRQDQQFYWADVGWDQSDKHPVVKVTWNDAAAFCDWMNDDNDLDSGFKKVEGQWDLVDYDKLVGIRLLTEAEYEYACRGGTETIYMTGDKIGSLEGFVNLADKTYKIKYPNRESEDIEDGEIYTSPVGKYKPNGFGLYDMIGNVRCGCLDWYDSRAYHGREEGVTDPKPYSGGKHVYRVLRGGSWRCPPKESNCRSASRSGCMQDSFNDYCGFRLCITIN